MEIDKSQHKKILITVGVATFMSALDASIINVALPQIQTYFNQPMATIEWIVLSYLLVISSLLLTYGKLGDMYGHKKMQLLGFVIFTVSSFICGISPNIVTLIIARGVQAIGAGMLMSMGPAIITDVTCVKDRGKALGINAVAISIALTSGPILGGILTSVLGWQSIFFVNVPIGIIGYIMCNKFIPDMSKKSNEKFDILGAVLVFLALVSLLIPLSIGNEVGWTNSLVIFLILFSIILFAMFIVTEMKSKNPMLVLSLFRNREFTLSNIALLVSFAAQFFINILMPFYFQQLRSMSPAKTGFMLIPIPLASLIVTPISGILCDKIDSKKLCFIGMSISTVGIVLLSFFNYNSSTMQIVICFLIIGAGFGLFQTPNTYTIMNSVSKKMSGTASSVQATMRNIGMVLGVAAVNSIFISQQNHFNITLKLQGLTGNALSVQSFTGAFHVTYIIATIIAAASAIVSLRSCYEKKKEKIEKVA
ncbi:MFS transporter [Clostridium estertheticum]|uniref:MFS transporter n=1 Tax=Clostridium estertheticum TaxID=238834 RepID=A0AA47I484_9CLOT|nr:MFS transporter [Clostridium estertheticum]WAG58957.1 MFS transporter [Clostridium estertheticum]